MLDEVDGLVTEAVSCIHRAMAAEALLNLTRAQGILSAMLDDAQRWERIQKAYEAGSLPREIVARFAGVTSDMIRSRAYRYGWVNPRKLAKVAGIKKNKNIMHIVCQQCELYFETSSGHAKVCPTCKAFESMGRERVS